MSTCAKTFNATEGSPQITISVPLIKKPMRAKERPQLRVASKSAKMPSSSSLKDDFLWIPSNGKRVRSKSSSSFVPNKGNFESKTVSKSDYNVKPHLNFKSPSRRRDYLKE